MYLGLPFTNFRVSGEIPEEIKNDSTFTKQVPGEVANSSRLKSPSPMTAQEVLSSVSKWRRRRKSPESGEINLNWFSSVPAVTSMTESTCD